MILILSTIILSVVNSCDKYEVELQNESSELQNDNENPPSDSRRVFYDSDSLTVYYLMKLQSWKNMQGGAIYNNKLVCLMATDEMNEGEENGYIYDLNTGKIQCSLRFASTLNGRKFKMPHANQVSFGPTFYSSDSDFPLLYVSQVNGGTGKGDISGERGVLVYNLRKNDHNTYDAELVQVIIPDLLDDKLMSTLGRYTPNYIVSSSRNVIIAVGYPNKSWYDLTGPQPFAVFPIPSISNQIVTLTSSDLLDSFFISESLGHQQSFEVNGNLFSVCGVAKQGSIRIIDLLKKEVKKLYKLSEITQGEPQFFGLWNNRFLYYEAGTEGWLYEFEFK